MSSRPEASGGEAEEEAAREGGRSFKKQRGSCGSCGEEASAGELGSLPLCVCPDEGAASAAQLSGVESVCGGGTTSRASSSSSPSGVDGPRHSSPDASAIQDLEDIFAMDSRGSEGLLEALTGSDAHRPVVAVPDLGPPPAADADAEDGWDDGEGYYKPRPGEVLGGRYRVIESVGQGVFAGVVRAVDEGAAVPTRVAIKIIRCNDMMTSAAEREVALLQRLARGDPDGRKRCIRLLANFTHRKHACLVFESMEMDLRKLNKQIGGGVGLSISAVCGPGVCAG